MALETDTEPSERSLGLSSQVQFYDPASQYGFAATYPDPDGDILLMRISAPSTFGWVALGTGHKMRGALIFIIFPAGGTSMSTSALNAILHATPIAH